MSDVGAWRVTGFCGLRPQQLNASHRVTLLPAPAPPFSHRLSLCFLYCFVIFLYQQEFLILCLLLQFNRLHHVQKQL